MASRRRGHRRHRSSRHRRHRSGRHRSGKSSARRKLQKYVQAMQSQAAASQAVPQAGQGGYINDAVPDSSTLLAYKLLKDNAGGNAAVFDDMLQNELKYLLGGIALLKNDAKIANEMGGESMANASKLASLIKSKTKELDWNDRIENIANNILYHDYAKPGKMGLAPQRIPSSILQREGNGVRLDYRISGATGFPIDVNRPGANANAGAVAGLPDIVPRALGPANGAGGAGPHPIGNAGFIRNRRTVPIFGPFGQI